MKTPLDKAFISFRIGTPQWMPPKRFQELLQLFEKYRGITDELALFSSITHAPLSLPDAGERAKLVHTRMAAARRLGCRAGINVLATIGQTEENLAHSLSGNFTPLTDSQGKLAGGAFCPNDERVRDYVRQLYQLMAGAEPDFIWIDDDIRLFGHAPVIETCFCDNCLDLFRQECGRRYTRDALRVAFTEGTNEQKLTVRRAWLQHNRNTIAKLLQLIEETVHALKPGLPLGFMSGERYYEGYDFDRWAKTLAGPGKAPVLWRPGGSFYQDDCLRDLLGKSHAVGRQASLLPECVVSIQSEIENFPYQRLQKSKHATTLEAAAHIAAGSTGAAFNVLSLDDEPLDEYEPLLEQIHQARPFLDLLARELGRIPPRGIHTGWHKDSFAVTNLDQGSWFDPEFWRMMGEYAKEVFELGLPVAYAPAGALVTLLTGAAPLAMGKAELLKVLSTGAYLDAQALQRLNQMGYGHLTGFEIECWLPADTLEEFTGDPLNGAFAGRQRDGRQAFWKCPAAILKPQSASVRTLARAVNYAGAETGACCMGLFENELSGRICVAGYYPWLFLQNLSKSSQIKTVMRWLAKDTLPVYVESFHKINLWVREPEPGRLAVVILNSCLDPAENVALMLRTNVEEVNVFDMQCGETRVCCTGRNGTYGCFVLPSISPWNMRLVVGGAPCGFFFPNHSS
ncbi:MAG: hypothetical protein HY360_12790 [Verrucomicrobia bacterium]|nr:hypothetical protein [Verrucomicrobiota bacterium]